MVKLNLAKSLKEIRRKRKLSQQALADKTKLSLWVITKIEQGRSKEPTIVTMAKLAHALDVTLDELIGRKEK